jgi:hypothetical protein
VKLVKGADLLQVEASFDNLSSKHIHTIAAKEEDSTKLLSEVNVLNVELATRLLFLLRPASHAIQVVRYKTYPV